MRRILALCAMAAATVGVSAAHAQVVTNERVSEPVSGFIPCANGGLGEDVSGDVRLHVLMTSTVNGNSVSGKYHFQPMGGGVVGLTTGDFYRATGVTQGTFRGSLVNGQYTETFVNNFRLIGPAPGVNYLEHEVFHITVNTGGEATVEFDHLSIECK